ncbi:triphosphoribosyl-dephospho-CoA synthase MdcB [Paraburkholderia rhizosphaerae]
MPRHHASHVAEAAVSCLLAEVTTWPKPGLVSHIDSGSHADMNAQTLRDSAHALQPFFAELADAGAANAGMLELRRIGLRAEREMLIATGGVNTHRGAIFGLGLLCAAAGLRAAHRGYKQETLGEIVARHWGMEILTGTRPAVSHGAAAERRYGAGGARVEAALGFPGIYHVALPALRLAYHARAKESDAARVHACFALIAKLEDTNLLYRGGLEGLRYAQQEAQAFLASGSIWQPGWRHTAQAIHSRFVARNLSPGGAADLLAMSLFVDAWDARSTR